ncbi:hypothetical protein TNCV_4211371 [Trichonephila clavipes]|nr:hypothetical protein TNCV_4211371 [Trichonephila clavipes]
MNLKSVQTQNPQDYVVSKFGEWEASSQVSSSYFDPGSDVRSPLLRIVLQILSATLKTTKQCNRYYFNEADFANKNLFEEK